MFLLKSLFNRCTSTRSQTKALTTTLRFYDFALSRRPPAPVAGAESVITMASWLELLAFRRPDVPSVVRYFLIAFSGAMDVNIPINRPSVANATKIQKCKPKKALDIPGDFVCTLEKEACNRGNPDGLRIYCSLTFLLTLSIMGFAETANVTQLFLTDSAVCGASLGRNGKNGAEMSRATPANGLSSNGGRHRPLFRLWGE